MKIALVGMSNIGKTYWANKFGKAGYEHIYVDNEVAKILSERERVDMNNEHQMSRWMGQPWDERYAQTKKAYLDTEIEIMNEVIDHLEKTSDSADILIDTTGSVVHLPDLLIKWMQSKAKVVCLDLDEKLRSSLLEQYLAHPKPVYWDDFYSVERGEDFESALARSYKNLLDFRLDKYRKIADVVVPYETHRAEGLTLDGFLKLI